MSIFHHTLFNRAAWDSHEATKALRNNRWMIPPLESHIERKIHAEIAVVPLLDPQTAWIVRRDFEPVEGNHIETMYNFVRTVENTIKHPKSSSLQRTLGSLTAQAVELQIPYVQDGLVENPLVPSLTRTRHLKKGTW